MKRLIIGALGLWASAACASLPGENRSGQCLPFALAYAAAHPGSKVVIVTYPTSPGKLAAHAFIHRGDWLCDNMHSNPRPAIGSNAVGWAYDLGYSTQGLKLFRTIDPQWMSAEDALVIDYLLRTVPK